MFTSYVFQLHLVSIMWYFNEWGAHLHVNNSARYKKKLLLHYIRKYLPHGQANVFYVLDKYNVLKMYVK